MWMCNITTYIRSKHYKLRLGSLLGWMLPIWKILTWKKPWKEPWYRSKTKFNNNESTADLATAFKINFKIMLKKLDKWMPHELGDRSLDERLEVCLACCNKHGNEEILNRFEHSAEPRKAAWTCVSMGWRDAYFQVQDLLVLLFYRLKKVFPSSPTV